METKQERLAKEIENAKAREARDKAATGKQKDFDYSGGGGPDSVPRPTFAGMDIAFRADHELPAPDVEQLAGTLNYSESEYVRAVEAGKFEPVSTPAEIEVVLKGLAKADNQREFRRRANIEIVRAGGGAKEIQELTERMAPLQVNHPESQAVLAEITNDIVRRMEEKAWET